MLDRRGWLVVLLMLAAGCGSASNVAAAPDAPATHPTPHASASPSSGAASSTPAPLADCGPAPVSNGASGGLISASVTGPATATSGSRLTLEVQLHSVDGAAHVFQSGASELAVLRDGRVVGEYEGGEAAYGLQATVGATDPAPWKVSGLLAGCPERPVDDGAPDLTRKALPPGPYDVVAVLPDVTGKPFGSLVSTPLRVQVTADPHALPTCGDVPTSIEPPQSRVTGTLVAPAAAKAGSTVQVQVLLSSNQGRAERFDSGLPADFLVVRDGNVVGRTDAVIAGVGIELTVPAQGTIPLISAEHQRNGLFAGKVTLCGCPQPARTTTAAVSESPRAPLPPGTYQLVGVVQDDLGDGHVGALVTQPMAVQVT